MNSEERDSQLSAMFDDELPETQCELLARRLARDEALKARWGRYATIGAAIRAERGVPLQSALAARVASAVSAEAPLAAASAARAPQTRSSFFVRWAQPAAGAALAAGVAVFAVLWMRDRAPSLTLLAQTQPVTAHSLPRAAGPQLVSAVNRISRIESDRYTVPVTSRRAPAVMPAQLANYVVAHSQFSMPWLRGNVLSGVAASEAGVTFTPLLPSADESGGVRDAAEAR